MKNDVSRSLFDPSSLGRHRLVSACVLAGALALAVPVEAIGGSSQAGSDVGVTTLGLAVSRPDDSNDPTPGMTFPFMHRTFVKLKYEHPDRDAVIIRHDRAVTRILEFGDAEGGLPAPVLDSLHIGEDQRSVYFSIGSRGRPCDDARELVVAVELGLVIGEKLVETRFEPFDVGTALTIGGVDVQLTRIEEIGGKWSLMFQGPSAPFVEEWIVRDAAGNAMGLWQSTHIDGTSWTCELRCNDEPVELELVHWDGTRKETRRIQTHVGVGL